ncbi:MAG: UvrD-helicase domain-containing protein [Bacteroidota bacterium]
MGGLKIYKASAGSGKTFALTQEYLLMLFRNPSLYRHILAVTFTNKATAEMKNRILDELNILAKGKDSKHKPTIKADLNLDEREIQKRAFHVLKSILHDYSRFSVSTIDRFFQRVIRTFARELGLQTGYTLETDEAEILNYVIDDLLLATEEDKQLRRWLVDFARSRMMEEKSWNFREEVTSLAGELMKEEVKDLQVSKISDKKTLNDYLKTLKQEQNRFENTLKGYGRQAVAIIEANDLNVNYFNRKGSGVARYFYYLQETRRDKLTPNQNVLNVLDEPDKWPAGKLKKEDKQLVISLAGDQLNPILREAVNYCTDNYERYQSVREIQKNIYVLGILGDIQKRLYEYCREKNLFLISDAADFLRDIISGNDAPFVYEKTGSIYHHFMIDEFQDTSRFQWENFKPLFRNSLSQNWENLMVGDVKQSIYRWRNGDWKILEDEVPAEFSHFPVEQEELIYNRRSLHNIISYNNTVFHFARHVLQNHFDSQIQHHRGENPWERKLLDAYRDVMQKLPEKREGGYVLNRFYRHLHNQQQEERQKIKDQLIQDIELLQDQNYNLSDIAIIVRKNREGQEIADALMEYRNSGRASSKYRYDVISNDSLYVSRAESVKFLLSLFHYLVKTDDAINKAFIKEAYNNTILKKGYGPQNWHALFREAKDEFMEHLPEAFLENLSGLKRMALYELTERLIAMFKLNKIDGEIQYIQAFQEIVLDFSRRYASDLNTFLQWWNENGWKKKLQLPENYDAIRITTIHKVKGLEFKAVLIPFCNWELDTTSSGTKKNYLWCRPDDPDLGKIGVVPVNYSGSLADTLFRDAYYYEKFHNYVDNLNLLYVALTRAEEVLLTYVPIQVKKDGTLNYTVSDKGLTTIGEMIHYIYSNYETLPVSDTEEYPFIKDLKSFWDEEAGALEWGELPEGAQFEDGIDNLLEQQDYTVYSTKPNLHLKYGHSEFFSDKTDLFQGSVDYGKLMHQVFANIHSKADIGDALDRIYLEGKVTEAEKSELQRRIEHLVNHSQVKDWFDGSWEVFTEREILLPDGKTYRPDRVMMKNGQTIVVDYKFGEKKDQLYKKQIGYYLKQIRNMGYDNPVGYIWYVNQNTLTEVST